jgi:hypothetical protein
MKSDLSNRVPSYSGANIPVILEGNEFPARRINSIGEFNSLLKRKDRRAMEAVQEFLFSFNNEVYLTREVISPFELGKYSTIDLLSAGSPEAIRNAVHYLNSMPFSSLGKSEVIFDIARIPSNYSFETHGRFRLSGRPSFFTGESSPIYLCFLAKSQMECFAHAKK